MNRGFVKPIMQFIAMLESRIFLNANSWQTPINTYNLQLDSLPSTCLPRQICVPYMPKSQKHQGPKKQLPHQFVEHALNPSWATLAHLLQTRDEKMHWSMKVTCERLQLVKRLLNPLTPCTNQWQT